MIALPFLQKMKHSPIYNYGGIPGLTSWLIGAPSPNGLVRLMECSRDHQEPIIPHSHRFDFECHVIGGHVRNVLWVPTNGGDEFQSTSMEYCGTPGQYTRQDVSIQKWSPHSFEYKSGDRYGMRADQIHSIYFGRDTSVLFFEGPSVSETSVILEPHIDGVTIQTFKVEPWAFKRGVA